MPPLFCEGIGSMNQEAGSHQIPYLLSLDLGLLSLYNFFKKIDFCGLQATALFLEQTKWTKTVGKSQISERGKWLIFETSWAISLPAGSVTNGCFRQQKIISHGSGVWKSKIGSQITIFFLCPHMVFSLCITGASLVSLCVSKFPLWAPVRLD